MVNKALNYLKNLHYSIFPVNQDKKPLVKWEAYQKKLPTEQEVRDWWTKFPQANIGIATGLISGIAVIDLDDVEAAKTALSDLIPDNMVFPIAKTPSGGEHWYFACVDGNIRNNTKIVPGADLRANGGFVVAPPSKNGNGKGWKWVDRLRPDLLALPYLPASYIDFVSSALKDSSSLYSSSSFFIKEGLEEKTSPQLSTQSTNVYKMFIEGRRDEDLFHVANCLFKGKMPEQEVSQVIEKLALSCNPPFDIKEIPAKIESAKKRVVSKERNLAHEVEEWVLSTNGNFLSTEIHKCLQLSTRQEQKNVSEILKRLKDKGIIEKWGDKNGSFRFVDNESQNIDWYNASVDYVNIKFPFEIEELAHIMPRNIIVVAGAPNAGKSAFLLNVVAMNMDKHAIYYFSSEMGAMELRGRMEKFDFPLSKWRFTAKERAGNFADVIRPDEINIIDFMEISDEFWKIGGMLKGIYDKLSKGIAIIALQKNFGTKMARGGVATLEKPRLYITLDAGICKIEKAKNWVRADVNPNGMQMNFKLVNGCRFIKEDSWQISDMEEVRR